MLYVYTHVYVFMYESVGSHCRVLYYIITRCFADAGGTHESDLRTVSHRLHVHGAEDESKNRYRVLGMDTI